MEDMIFQLFFVVPLTRWITNPDRPWNKKSQRNGILLAVLALCFIGVLQSRRETLNHYEMLGVAPNAPPKIVSTTYRKLSLMYHPDKNPSVEAKEMFARIREAHEILANERLRDAYGRFGDFSKEGEIDETQFYDMMLLAIFQFLIPFLFGYLYTYGDDSVLSRELFSCYLGIAFSLEVLLRFDRSAYGILSFAPLIGSFLPFEKVKLLQSWVPIILNGLLLLGTDLVDNDSELLDEVARTLLESNLETLPCLERYLDAAETYINRVRGLKGRSELVKLSTTVEEREKSVGTARGLGGSEPRASTSSTSSITVDTVEPWRLNCENPSSDMPDLWMEVIQREMKNWPEDLTLEDVAAREECTEDGWDERHTEYVNLLERVEDEEERSNGGVSMGTIFFFAMLLLRWYNGGS